MRDFPNSKLTNSKKIIKENCKDILKYLDDGDKEKLKNMFCKKILFAEEEEEEEERIQILDRQIEEAIDFFEGRTVSYKTKTSIGTISSEHGIVTRLRLNVIIEDIKTDTDKKYNVKFYLYLICEEDRDIEGITKISIKSDSGEERVIGQFIK